MACLVVEFECGAFPAITEESNRPDGIVTDRDITTPAVANGRNPL